MTRPQSSLNVIRFKYKEGSLTITGFTAGCALGDKLYSLAKSTKSKAMNGGIAEIERECFTTYRWLISLIYFIQSRKKTSSRPHSKSTNDSVPQPNR